MASFYSLNFSNTFSIWAASSMLPPPPEPTEFISSHPSELGSHNTSSKKSKSALYIMLHMPSDRPAFCLHRLCNGWMPDCSPVNRPWTHNVISKQAVSLALRMWVDWHSKMAQWGYWVIDDSLIFPGSSLVHQVYSNRAIWTKRVKAEEHSYRLRCSHATKSPGNSHLPPQPFTIFLVDEGMDGTELQVLTIKTIRYLSGNLINRETKSTTCITSSVLFINMRTASWSRSPLHIISSYYST